MQIRAVEQTAQEGQALEPRATPAPDDTGGAHRERADLLHPPQRSAAQRWPL